MCAPPLIEIVDAAPGLVGWKDPYLGFDFIFCNQRSSFEHRLELPK